MHTELVVVECMNNPTIKDLIDFIVINRKGTAFKDYPHNKICAQILESIDNGTMGYVTNQEGKIIAVALGRKNEKDKIYYCDDILSLTTDGTRQLIMKAKELFPGYALQGINRHGRQRNFTRVNKLIERI